MLFLLMYNELTIGKETVVSVFLYAKVGYMCPDFRDNHLKCGNSERKFMWGNYEAKKLAGFTVWQLSKIMFNN